MSLARHLRNMCAITVLLPGMAVVAQESAPPPITIRVLEGEGALNDVRLRRAHPPIISVLDEEGRPISGAAVTFLLPSTGASGTFVDSGLSVTVPTDEKGVAVGRGLRPNRLAGQFHIRVTTSWRGAVASASILQTNVDKPSKSSTNKKIAIFALVGGAAIGGAVAATQGGKGSRTNSAVGGSTGGTAGGSTGTTIIGGPPSLGGPN